ncbi:S1 family peptidase [Actinokineospora globicatena]|uniref:S1 family peptidase n=1 Tax=Actinokineospora globicatena TaxID=103729 RepID=UPI0020A4EFEC|nr:S1 family peptidase [Actinokineospora globicatena]MCP2306155.1 hypothetical protein [Actinokineospora globicatena]GLW79971.1 hypothetical protein Aglo01_44520 [Actinokineospora globicatena]GLW86800.1 hypothetical protein Aglo02_44390 [Actinokineospora globicatena]
MPAAGNKQVRPLVGGIRVEGRRGTDQLATATLGLVISADGPLFTFVTAGHAVGNAGDLVGQPGLAVTAGVVETNLLTDGADLAVVSGSVGIPAKVGGVWVDDNTTITVKFDKPGLPDIGASVVLQGANSGAVTGTVLHKKADVRDGTTGELAHNVVVVDYTHPTTVGDSGAPVLSALQDGALCYGLHGGFAVIEGKRVGWFTPFANIEW